MTRNIFKEKIIKSIIFRSKLANKSTIKFLNNGEFDDVVLYFIDSMPEPITLKDCNNQFSWIKKYSNYLLDKYHNSKSELGSITEKYKKFIRESNATSTYDFSKIELELYESYIREIDLLEKLVNLYQEMIMRYHSRIDMICKIYNDKKIDLIYFSQLIGQNPILAKKNIQIYIDNTDKNTFYDYLFWGIENDQSEEGWKSNKSNGMPLFHLIHTNFIILMDRNKEVKQKVRDFTMHEMGMADAMVTIKEDEDGNKTVEKYYPPLKILK
jgi:hypothetical protein